MPNQIKNVLSTGASSLHANAVSGFTSSALTATGTNQATGLVLASDVNEFTTVGSGTAAILPANCSPSDEVVIANFGANALLVFPALGESINAVATNGSFSLAAGKNAYFVKSNATRWAVILSA